jgi:hypothetical protein
VVDHLRLVTPEFVVPERGTQHVERGKIRHGAMVVIDADIAASSDSPAAQ